MPQPVRFAALAVLAVCSAGCILSPERAVLEADAEVLPLLAEAEQSTLASRESQLERPLPEVEQPESLDEDALPAEVESEDETSGTSADGSTAPAPLLLDLQASLAQAFRTGRDYLNQKESLYQTGLGLTLTRHSFGPQLDATIALLWADSENAAGTSTLGGSFGLSQRLHEGGSFGLTTSLSRLATGGNLGPGVNDPAWSSAVNFSFDQPLLRGYGHEVSHEALTQAERNLIYSVRDFELFRQDHSIDIARDHFDLVSQRQRLSNLEQNYRDALFDRDKSDALRQVDRNRDEDVFLARRRLINAESDVLAARADYRRAVDSFKIRLGLSTDTPVEIADDSPPYEPVRLDADSAVSVALANRLDLRTAAERLQDDERALRIAADGLRPDLGLSVDYGQAGAGNAIGPAKPDDWSASAGLTLSLPLNRQAERNAYRSTQIALDRSRRDYELLLDGVDRDIRDQLRQLRRIEQQIELQIEQIAQEQRAVAVTEIRYEAGDAESRDLLDARQSLVDAQNALIDLKASHYTSRLRLLRDLGLLFVSAEGMWRQ
ncbi:MAG: TolC family protein [Planctomycetota bacterium]